MKGIDFDKSRQSPKSKRQHEYKTNQRNDSLDNHEEDFEQDSFG